MGGGVIGRCGGCGACGAALKEAPHAPQNCALAESAALQRGQVR
jgi:hypothetical protein